MTPRKTRIVVGVTGATGAVLAIRLLEILRSLDVETHLIFSKWALATMKYETDIPAEHVRKLATYTYALKDLTAPPSSGSFLRDGMIIKGRKLVLVVRETPLSAIHLENMSAVQRAGATIFPPVPAFYTIPKTIEDVIEQSVGRMLDSLGIHVDGFERGEDMRKD
ncbi:hypothetical protein PHYSODRAFT_310787 [Phytophthora sojae]|uniref:Flavoprotein domain-containing protein n=1 Tax=Phytophthora sojae (strain P6497) TaxID=1094619 RepID=G4YRJ9_PHYSP|nr:hypothetical protein PHYSODRAFT_310787 [Phytophthora sojae]EGZ23464.1 hypothetical protein PHYSODRAFT_310787 [Phytophthora sojae]|eukprot:XP_009518752.1 hypothetical protein PHYSODRAFT_310787 [Phytophthora sojae]